MSSRLLVRLLPAITADRMERGAWSVAAQALSSGSNLALQLGLALTLGPGPFGSMVVGLSCYYLALGLGRAWVGDPLAALGDERRTADGAGGTFRLWRRSRWRILAMGAGAAGGLGLVAAWAAPVRAELLVLALAAPVLLLQDGYRYLSWSLGRPDRVAALDGLWLGVFAAVMAVVVAVTGEAGVEQDLAMVVVAAWVGGGVASAAAGMLVTGSWGAAAGPAGPAGASATVEPGARVEQSLGASQTILAVDGNGLPVVVAAVAGSAVTGGLRAATLPFLPLVSILGAVRVLTLPVLRRSVVDGHPVATVVKVVGLFAAVAAVVCAAGLGLVYAVPAAWLGPTGEVVRPWYPLAAVVVAARMITLPMTDLLSLGADPERAVRYRAGTTAIDWLATVAGAAGYGLAGAITAKAAAMLVATAIWVAAVAQVSPVARSGETTGRRGE